MNNLNLGSTAAFDSNVGGDNQLFLDLADLGGGPAPAILSFDGALFSYDPSQGDLLLDIQITGIAQTAPSNFDARNTTAAGLFSRAHDFGSGFANYGLVTGFRTGVNITLDIKPGSDPNSINCNNDSEVITVAILTTAIADGDAADFDATTVDHTTVMFEGAYEAHVNRQSGVARRHEEDVDNDGDTDLVLHFRLGETDLDCSSTEGTLTGETFDGVAFEGADGVRMVEGTTVITVGQPIP